MYSSIVFQSEVAQGVHLTPAGAVSDMFDIPSLLKQLSDP